MPLVRPRTTRASDLPVDPDMIDKMLREEVIRRETQAEARRGGW